MEKVTVVVLHYHQKELTDKALSSIADLKKNNFKLEVIVVNNNPQDDLKKLQRKYHQFIFLKMKRNLGFTGGNNLGINRAIEGKSDWILLLNNDVFVDQNLLVQLIKVGNSKPEYGILGPKIFFTPGKEYHFHSYRDKDRGKVIWYAGGKIDWKNVFASHRGVDEVDQDQFEQIEETDFITGCAMMVKKEVFSKIGLLDERYFLYLEDLNFCQRAKDAGFKIVYVPKAKVWHFNAGSSHVGGSLHDYFLTRNRMLFGMRYAPLRTRWNLAEESFKLLLTGRPWQKIAIKDFYLRKFGQGSWHE